ncbi:hypothetical protein RBB50_009314 [Rhinocladiella similis]
MPWLNKTWKEMRGGKPFAIKGIQSVADARKCVEVGCDGVVVSDHAGRQVDDAVASLRRLGANRRWYVGAKFVFVGRLWTWGLSIMGEHGVRHITKRACSPTSTCF